ncbi:hypothetical protein LJK88_45110 [Paenibacillus sp. P26]|nr:hypothetical protein LJK88_45110 [Paenibacillus sp. P26]
MDIMMSELSRIEHIISELLRIAKPQSVAYRLRPVGPLLNDVISLLESEAHLNGIEITPLLEGELPGYTATRTN